MEDKKIEVVTEPEDKGHIEQIVREGHSTAINIKDFAEKHRLKVTRDDCNEPIIAGRLGQIYEYSDTEMGVMFMLPPTKAEPWGKWCPKTWGNRRRTAEALGMVTRQNGDSEGCLSFDPDNRKQVAMAVRIAKVRPKRVLSPEQLLAAQARAQHMLQSRQEVQ